MLDIKIIRKNPQEVEAKLKTKAAETDLGPLVETDNQIRHKKTAVEQLKAKRNEFSDQIGKLKRTNQKFDHLMLEVTHISEEIYALDQELIILEAHFLDAMARLPNLPMDDILVSSNPQENVVVRQSKEKPQFDFPFKNHLELNEMHQLFDFERGAKLTGSGWPIYRAKGAELEWALINYMIDFHLQNGYTMHLPPVVVRKDVLFSAGQLPKFENQQYRISEHDHDLFLIPTAEVALNALYSDEILPEEILPFKYIAYTPCFRREAGGAGTQERGLIRMHQFNKVEMFAFCLPGQSGDIFNEMVSRAEQILESLELPFRTMLLVTGDMSFAASRTIDVEVWLPGQNRYQEVSSISNCTDYQARRSNTRFRRKGEKPEFVHTLNGSGLATSRLMVALLENNQQKDGSIVIPKVIRPYLRGQEKLIPVK
jgi:seryl-tRNA synthetase